MSRRALALAGALIVGVSVSGCGSSDEEQVRGAVRDYFAAVVDGDWDRACELSATEVRADLERIDGGTTCERAMDLAYRLDERGRRQLRERFAFEVVAVRVEGDRARVRLREALTPDGEPTAELRREEGDWRIAS